MQPPLVGNAEGLGHCPGDPVALLEAVTLEDVTEEFVVTAAGYQREDGGATGVGCHEVDLVDWDVLDIAGLWRNRTQRIQNIKNT